MTREQWNYWLVFARGEKKSRLSKKDNTEKRINESESTAGASAHHSSASAKIFGNTQTSQLVNNLLNRNVFSVQSEGPKSSPKLQRRQLKLQDDGVHSASQLHEAKFSDDHVAFYRSKSPRHGPKQKKSNENSTRPQSAPRLRSSQRDNTMCIDSDSGRIAFKTPVRIEEIKNGKVRVSPQKQKETNSQCNSDVFSAIMDPNRLDLSVKREIKNDKTRDSPQKPKETSLRNNSDIFSSILMDPNRLDLSEKQVSKAPQVQTPYVMQQPPPAPSLGTKSQNSSPVNSNKRASPFKHNRSVNRPSASNHDDFHQQLYTMSNSKKSHPPEIVYKSQTYDIEKEENIKIVESESESRRGYQHVSPSTIAAAKASTLRIESAYAAAECMRASLQADSEKSSNGNSKKAENALTMLDMMMKSLEKSKVSLKDILSPSGAEVEVEDATYQHQAQKVKQSHNSRRSLSTRDGSVGSAASEQRSVEAYFDQENISDDSSYSTQSKPNDAAPKDYSFTPGMETLRTAELSGGLDERWDNVDGTPDGYGLRSSQPLASPDRQFKSSLMDSSSSLRGYARKSDFHELTRPTRTSTFEEQESRRGSVNVHGDEAAHAISRYRERKAKKGSRVVSSPRVWRICLSIGPLTRVRFKSFVGIEDC